MWSAEQIAEHISSDPNVCFGKPVIRGTRICWVGDLGFRVALPPREDGS